MSGLTIGINALFLIPGGVGGTQIYMESLLQALDGLPDDHRYVVFANQRWSPTLATNSKVQVMQCPISGMFRPARIAFEQICLPFQLWKHRIDVLLNAGFTAPLMRSCPVVTVFHDLQHKRHPEFFRWFDLPFWNSLLWISARSSERLIAVSSATALDLERFYPGTGAKTAVVNHGVDPDMFRVGERRTGNTAASGDRFLLCVSTSHPHKNLGRLLRAFAQFHKGRPEFRLVIAGLKGFAHEALERLCADLGLSCHVRFTGWIPRTELLGLMEQADAFVYPSLFEGFGLPVIEALAAGVPTACSDIEPIRSLVGEVAHTFDPLDVSAIGRALERITGDAGFRSATECLGPAQVRDLTWIAAATATLRELAAAKRA